MANPNPPLAGIGDPGDPNWKENVLARLAESQRTRGDNGQARRKANVRVFFDTPFMHMLQGAARLRNISLSGYVRRAIAARVAADLGLPFTEVVGHMAAPTDYGQPQRHGPGGVKQTTDDGTGYGDWAIR